MLSASCSFKIFCFFVFASSWLHACAPDQDDKRGFVERRETVAQGSSGSGNQPLGAAPAAAPLSGAPTAQTRVQPAVSNSIPAMDAKVPDTELVCGHPKPKAPLSSKTVVALDGLNVRSQPDLISAAVDVFEENTRVEVWTEPKTAGALTWVCATGVGADGHPVTGWVSSGYLQ